MSALCPACGIEKDTGNTFRDKSRSGGLSSWCKACATEKRKTKYFEYFQRYESTRNGELREANQKKQRCIVCGVEFESNRYCADCGSDSCRAKVGLVIQHEMISGCKEYKDKIKGVGCCVCGYKKCLSALDFHHLYGEKDKLISSITSLPRLKKEIEKNRIVVLCAVCHREAHEGLISDNYLESSALIWGGGGMSKALRW